MIETINRHAVIFSLKTGERVKVYDKIAELLTSSSVNQQFNSPNRFLRYIAFNKINKDQQGQTRVEVSFRLITDIQRMSVIFN